MQAYSPIGGQPGSSFVQNSGFYGGGYFHTQSPMAGYVRGKEAGYLPYTTSQYPYGKSAVTGSLGLNFWQSKNSQTSEK